MVSASGNGGMVMIMALLLRAGEVEEVVTLPAGEGELRLLFVVVRRIPFMEYWSWN